MGVYSYAQRSAGRFGKLSEATGLTAAQPAIFPQAPGSLDWLLGPALQELPQSEDAFQVAVFAPQDAKDLPVMVFLPGGGFVSGAGTVRWYDAQDFAEKQNCVVAVVNYRIGLLAHNQQVGGGNTPPEELLLALEWVQRNIAELGGNPQEVTLAGQSAGAFWAFVLAQLEAARGLFNRLYVGSLSFQPPMGETQAQERNAVMAQALNGTALAEASSEQLLAAGTALAQAWAGRGLGLYPSADESVPADLFDTARAVERLHVKQLLLSYTADEASAFIGMAPEQAFTLDSVRGFIAGNFNEPQEVFDALIAAEPQATAKSLMVRAMSLHQIQLFAVELADAAAAAGIQVQLLGFEVRSPLPHAGSAHCLELPFLFGNRERWQDAPMLDGVADELFEQTAKVLGDALGSFICLGTAATSVNSALAVHQTGAQSLTALDETGLIKREIQRPFSTRRPVLA
ncbi:MULTISPECIES: carboxylesterase family protein [Micrococcaceae]|uniref:carboxylesterase family protein n=1 Tax=Micrococcaceae TaxID=1268 RepID=UPI0010600625|nr:carboxylesterase family protein [Arthrobacter sp. JUb115]TDU27240.1 para-nitrobenzyl esterase [Arthrobacter sp. JUb115]